MISFPISFMGRGVIDAPLQVVADFMKDIRSSFAWDDLLVVSFVVLLFFLPRLVVRSQINYPPLYIMAVLGCTKHWSLVVHDAFIDSI